MAVTVVTAEESAFKLGKLYLDDEEFSASVPGDSFHVHIGNNVWLVTNTVHRDKTGLYTYEHDIIKNVLNNKISYEKSWKCPYCYQYWPVGKPCQNEECASRYR